MPHDLNDLVEKSPLLLRRATGIAGLDGIWWLSAWGTPMGAEGDDPHAVVLGEIVACAEDVDGSGDVGFGDVLEVLSAWGPYEPCPPYLPSDINQDCDVAFNDLLLVLAAWGPCK